MINELLFIDNRYSQLKSMHNFKTFTIILVCFEKITGGISSFLSGFDKDFVTFIFKKRMKKWVGVNRRGGIYTPRKPFGGGILRYGRYKDYGRYIYPP